MEDEQDENVKLDEYELMPKKNLNPIYSLHGDFKARLEARNPSDLLDDKFAFIFQKTKKNKEKNNQKRLTSDTEKFKNSYNLYLTYKLLVVK